MGYSIWLIISPQPYADRKGVKNATVTQWWTDKTLCQVRIWAEIIIQLESYSGTTCDKTVNTVWVDIQKTTINSQMTTKSLRSGTLPYGKETLGFSQKEVKPHSNWSGFAMGLYLAKL